MKYFSIEELCASSTARARKIDNTPSQDVINNLVKLVDNVLDPLRELYGKPIKVNSGYRCPQLNKAVGGVSNSEHLYGCAADIVGTPNNTEENSKLFSLISDNFPFRQLIWEGGGRWIHISYNEADNKGQKLSL